MGVVRHGPGDSIKEELLGVKSRLVQMVSEEEVRIMRKTRERTSAPFKPQIIRYKRFGYVFICNKN